MDSFARHYFRLVFRERFRDAHGDEFQRFFGDIMSLRYPGDFNQTRPWGKLGDEKCDGFLPSERKFYQCHGPERPKLDDILSKLQKDFEGALPHAGTHFDVWVWVHNDPEGRLPTQVALALDELREKHPSIRIEVCGCQELLAIAQGLDPGTLADYYGPFPSVADLLAVQFRDIKPLVEHLARQAPAPLDGDRSPVPPRKIEFNRLSEDAAFFLNQGRLRARTVREYLDAASTDRTLAARVAGAFRAEYEKLRDAGNEPDDIFRGLRIFAQGPFAQMPKTESAVFAVLAYLFEECDIFERPPTAEAP